jgi:uncharacterized protein YndB with AHSA1/START domain
VEGILVSRDGLAELRFGRGDLSARFDRTYDVGIARVWAALTEPALLERWLGAVSGAPLRRGGTLSVEAYGRPGVSCEVAYLDPERMIEVHASPDTGAGWRVLVETVGLTDSRALLVLEVRGLAANATAACAGWWHGRLANLSALLDGQPVGERTGGSLLVEEYAAALALLIGDE